MGISAIARITLVLLAVLLSACAAQTPTASKSVIEEHQQLLRGAVFFPVDEPLPELEPVELLAVNDDMRAFLKQHIPNKRVSEEYRSKLLLKALLTEGLELNYNNMKTYTAQQTFYAREGNCLSFTNLYMALAREAGLIVSYQEVQVPPSWSAVGDTHYFSLHMNVLLDLPRKAQVIDFDTQTGLGDSKSKVVSDRTATAQYYNNMAVHYLSISDLPSAFLQAHKAIELRPHTGYFWANLGTIMRRANDEAAAEEAYLAAIEISAEPAAVSNLARLYKKQGRLELADQYAQRAKSYRQRNPYYLYQMAQQAYSAENYREANRLMGSAIQRREDVEEFHHLQGLIWAQLGKAGKAKKSFELAARFANSEHNSSLYAHKLQLLARQD
jgi:tetratricopeptide (TPR) repeat protein